MDYKVTIDRVYKQQRPFKLTLDDLLLVSHEGYSKVASVQELSNVVRAQVVSELFDIIAKGVFDKLSEVDTHVNYIVETMDGLSDEARYILKDLKDKLNDNKITPKDVINDLMWLLISIINHNPGDKVYPVPEGKYLTPAQFIEYLRTGKFNYDGLEFESRFIADIQNLGESFTAQLEVFRDNLVRMISTKVSIEDYANGLSRLTTIINDLKTSLEDKINNKVSNETYSAFLTELERYKILTQEAINSKLNKDEFTSELTKLVSKSDFIKYMENGYVVSGDTVTPVE